MTEHIYTITVLCPGATQEDFEAIVAQKHMHTLNILTYDPARSFEDYFPMRFSFETFRVQLLLIVSWKEHYTVATAEEFEAVRHRLLQAA